VISIEHVFAVEEVSRLIGYAASKRSSFERLDDQTAVLRDLGPMASIVKPRLEANLSYVLRQLKIAGGARDIHAVLLANPVHDLHARLAPASAVHFLYLFASDPSAFEGGEVHLSIRKGKKHGSRPVTLQPKQNSALFFAPRATYRLDPLPSRASRGASPWLALVGWFKP
jgi:Rps23 Pro-64 3,4-dihydroxylase Tpa1-like proline 4-hydroxylase